MSHGFMGIKPIGKSHSERAVMLINTLEVLILYSP